LKIQFSKLKTVQSEMNGGYYGVGPSEVADALEVFCSKGDSIVSVQQVAVIPFQRSPVLNVLLIRKLPNGSWGVPKGGIADHGNDIREAARLECLEEAGADGRLGADFVGEFSYRRADKEYHVRVLLMEVTGLRDQYLELGYRERRWFSINEAASVLGREPLRWLVVELPRWVADDECGSDPGTAPDYGGM
jgi:8-oxo-dGTP pyrophosphatase MutT (NUDIX family)